MSRPMKDGIDYFSFDTDFFSDDKIRLLRGELGVKAVMLYIYLLCEIYRTDGYFKKWDDDCCILASEGAFCGSKDFTSQVINACIRRSLFDKKLFDTHKILTSKGIQRRYIKSCSARDEIRINKEYFLLDVDNKKDVSEGTLNKLIFFDENSRKNKVNSRKNEVNSKNNPQRKVKESKEKEKENIIPLSFSSSLSDEINKWFSYKQEKGDPLPFRSKIALIGKIENKLKDYSQYDIIELIELCIERNWQGIIWDKINKREESRESSFDIDALDKVIRSL